MLDDEDDEEERDEFESPFINEDEIENTLDKMEIEEESDE